LSLDQIVMLTMRTIRKRMMITTMIGIMNMTIIIIIETYRGVHKFVTRAPSLSLPESSDHR
jgi:hypothetical protein